MNSRRVGTLPPSSEPAGVLSECQEILSQAARHPRLGHEPHLRAPADFAYWARARELPCERDSEYGQASLKGF